MLDCGACKEKRNFILYCFTYFYIILYDFINWPAFVKFFSFLVYHPKLRLNYFPFLGKLNLLNIAVYLPTCQYFGRMEKKFVPSESRIAFCRLFIVRVKMVCYERKVLGELLGCFFFHSTLEWRRPYVPTTSFGLMALRNRVECQCYNETNIPPS